MFTHFSHILYILKNLSNPLSVNMTREDIEVFPWSLSDQDFDLNRNVYICVHAAVEIGCIRSVLEEILQLPDDIVRIIAYYYYMGGGTIGELETSKPDFYMGWNHPQKWWYKLPTDYKPLQP